MMDRSHDFRIDCHVSEQYFVQCTIELCFLKNYHAAVIVSRKVESELDPFEAEYQGSSLISSNSSGSLKSHHYE